MSEEKDRDLRRRLRDDPASVSGTALIEGIARSRGESRRRLVRAVEETVRQDPHHASSFIDGLTEPLESEDPHERRAGAELIATIASERPEAARSLTKHLAERLDDPIVSTHVERALTSIARSRPAALDPTVPALGRLFQGASPTVADPALHLLGILVEERPESVEPVVPYLIDVALREGDRSERSSAGRGEPRTPTDERDPRAIEEGYRRQKRAAGMLGAIVEHRSDALVGHVPTIANGLRDLSSSGQQALLEVLIPLADRDPSAIEPAIGPLCDLLVRTDSQGVSVRSAWLLALSAEAAPETVAEELSPRVGVVVDLLQIDEPEGRAAAAGILSYLAEHRRDHLERHRARIRASLDDPNEAVRANVVWALGLLGESRDTLREVAESDESGMVRDVVTAMLQDETPSLSESNDSETSKKGNRR